MFTEQLSQALALPAADVFPANRASNTVVNGSTGVLGIYAGPIDMSKFRRVIAKVTKGVGVGASCSVVGSFAACNTGGNTVTSTFTQVSGGPSITLTTDNTSGTIEMRADQMPTNTQYLMLTINQICAGCTQAEVWGGECVYKPANQYDCTNTSVLAARNVM